MTGSKPQTRDYSFVISNEDDLAFSAARVAVLMSVAESRGDVDKGNNEDLASIDFFASHPFIVFEPGSKEYLTMQHHGFSETIEYAHPEPIFANHKDKSKAVLSYLLAKGIIAETMDKTIRFTLTELGKEIASNLDEDYFIGYAFAVEEILKLVPKQQNRWKELQKEWLEAAPGFTRS